MKLIAYRLLHDLSGLVGQPALDELYEFLRYIKSRNESILDLIVPESKTDGDTTVGTRLGLRWDFFDNSPGPKLVYFGLGYVRNPVIFLTNFRPLLTEQVRLKYWQRQRDQFGSSYWIPQSVSQIANQSIVFPKTQLA